MAQINNLPEITAGKAVRSQVTSSFEQLRQEHNANDTRVETLEGETQPVNRGGTNLKTYTIGDLLYASAANILSKLGIGTSGQVLQVNSGATAPEWVDSLSFKEYGLDLAHKATDLITVAAGARWSDDRTKKFSIVETDYDAGSLANGTYYIFGGFNSGGTAVIETDINASGSGLSTIASGETSLGRFVVSGDAVDTTQFATYHADGTKNYTYQQASGNFPSEETTITHNLNSWDVEYECFAKENATGKLYPLQSIESSNYHGFTAFVESATAIIIPKSARQLVIMPSGGVRVAVTNSTSYRLKVTIKTRLA